MSTWQMLWSAWHWKPELVIGCSALAVGYVWRLRPPLLRALSFLTGLLILALALVSPLDALSHEYLFSAHMLQHLLMTLVVPPLLLLGLPHESARRITDLMTDRASGKVLASPVVAWVLAMVVMWVWHAPVLYGAALASNRVHILQHAMFLGSALLFWWPVVVPVGGPGSLVPWARMLYLFLAAIASTALGIVLTFAPPGLYPHYLSPVDHHGLLRLVREGWGLSPAEDQQLGGLLMWIPGGVAYSVAVLVTFARWFTEPEDENVCGVPTSRLVLSASGELRLVEEVEGVVKGHVVGIRKKPDA